MLLLVALRGIEALGKGGVSAAMLKRAADAALEALPTPNVSGLDKRND